MDDNLIDDFPNVEEPEPISRQPHIVEKPVSPKVVQQQQ